MLQRRGVLVAGVSNRPGGHATGCDGITFYRGARDPVFLRLLALVVAVKKSLFDRLLVEQQ